jgi:hypothetical protein
MEEFNHACYFISQMDLFDYMISRKLFNKLFTLSAVKRTLLNVLRKLPKATPLQKEKSLIYPHTDSYLQCPDYFYLKSKREDYKDLNLKATLERLNIPVESLAKIEEPKEVRKPSKSQSQRLTRENSVEIKPSSNKEIIEQNSLNNPTSIVELLKGIDLNNINEFYPKNFRIVRK